MENNKYQRGSEIMMEKAGEQGKQALESIKSFSPDFANILVETFGEIYSRPILNSKQRELISLSSLITQGANEDQLQFHFNAGLNAGLTLDELIEVIIHCIGYTGFPKALNAFQVLQKVSSDKK